MSYEQELELLRDTFYKSRVTLSCLDTAQFYALCEVNPLQSTEQGEADASARKLFLQSLVPHTMYKQTDAYRRAWVYFLLPKREEQNVLLMGPYLAAPISDEALLEMSEENGFSPQMQRTLQEYYASLPVLRDTNLLFVMLETFCERIWSRPSFAVVDVNREHRVPVSLLSEALGKVYKLRICTKTLRSIEHKGGLDAYLMATPDSKLTEEAKKIKKVVADKVSA